MILHEFLRLISLRPVLFTVVFAVPLIILVSLVPGIRQPVSLATNPAAINAKIDALPNAIRGLTQVGDEATYAQLLDAWVAFAGQTDDMHGDHTGVYSAFYHADIGTHELRTIMINAYRDAHYSFMEFFELYQRYIQDFPTVFIPHGRFHAFTEGIERIHHYFTWCESRQSYGPFDPHWQNFQGVPQLNNIRHGINTVRRQVPFRTILANSRSMQLTTAQGNSLLERLNQLNAQRQTHAHNMTNFVDFSHTVYNYMVWRINEYAAQNADFSTSGFYGFDTITRSLDEQNFVRARWLIENNEIGLNFGYPPGGLGFATTFTIMHERTGTTVADFVHDANEIITIAMLFFVILLTTYSIFKDINDKTILGAVASRHGRRTIILTKIAACVTVSAFVLAIFWVIFFILGGLLIGSMMYPPTILVVIGTGVFPVTASIYLLVTFLLTMVQMIAVISLTAFLSVVVKQNQYLLYAPPAFLATVIILLGVFMAPFSLFGILMYPLLITS